MSSLNASKNEHTCTVSTLNPIATYHQRKWSRMSNTKILTWNRRYYLSDLATRSGASHRVLKKISIPVTGTKSSSTREDTTKESIQNLCTIQVTIRTFPAESNPSMRIRTSWSLLQLTREERELNKVDIERPMEVQRQEL